MFNFNNQYFRFPIICWAFNRLCNKRLLYSLTVVKDTRYDKFLRESDIKKIKSLTLQAKGLFTQRDVFLVCLIKGKENQDVVRRKRGNVLFS